MTDKPQLLIAHHLKALKLPTFLRKYDKVARQCAAEGVDHTQYLLRLAELELIERERRMVERRIKEAKFPAVKSLDSFDFLALPSLNKALLAPGRVGSPRGPRNHDGTIIPDTVDTMWGTDLTTTFTGEGQAAVFVAVDHCSGECVGIHAHARATRFEALEPIRQGVRRHFGGFDKDIARGLAVRHDHGSQYMSDYFQKEIELLGIESSPAFVRAPEGNGCAERFIRTLKENLLWIHTFQTIEELRHALLVFRDTYNTTWLIERHGFISPAAFRQSQIQPDAKAA
jgi:putative transposase